MNKIIGIILLFLNYIICVSGNDVLGCGGFLKSHVQIDFSKVEVKLLTKQGTLKDKTNCAPNGYYFIPLYDKGEYILQLEPLPGWSFTPTKVNLVVDGKTDLCSQSKDINFSFKGFGITGKVESFGTDSEGPEGVKVELHTHNEVRSTTTTTGGLFFFTPVYPGNYNVVISHPKWRISKNAISGTVTEGNTELLKNSLIVEGYDLKGAVSSNGHAMKDVTILLFKSDIKRTAKVSGCSPTSIENLKLQENFVCHINTDENGIFTFPSISNGEYYVQPFYKQQNIHFYPTSLNFVVNHDSVTLNQNFEVSGFGVSGRVLNSINGKPLNNAVVFVNGQESTKTDSNGRYTLEKMKTGSYNIRIEYKHLEFVEKSLKLNPTTLVLPDFYPASYEICGVVTSEYRQEISITKVGANENDIIYSETDSGKFCKYLTPGKYELKVLATDNRLQFFPLSQIISVLDKPISDIIFSQLKAYISGDIICLIPKDCHSLKVILNTALDNDITDGKKFVATVYNGKYKFENVRPGKYEVILSTNNFCWEQDRFVFSVNTHTHQVPAFKQIGYSVVFLSTHDAKVSYVDNALKTISFDISKGTTPYCIDKPRVYNFTFDGCHVYEPKSIEYDPTNSDNEINVFANMHKVTVKVKANSNYGDIFFIVNIDGSKQEKGPLKFKEDTYDLELFLKPDEHAILKPQSDTLYFIPAVKTLTGTHDCQNFGVQFEAIKGKVFKGEIIPPLPDVLITVESVGATKMIIQSDSKGKYKSPPLDGSKTYTITASKESYLLSGPDKDGNFLAHKLAEIFVQVLDEDDNTPLQGALLSLSGGESYRSNLQTNEEGKISFHSLRPSEYFLRPMMKEYSFQPPSKIINVKEGATVNVLLKGKRVAYSAYGQIMSLNGEPEGKMIVLATGIGNCSEYSEEATSDINGQFRIRGLQPYCSYDLKVKGSFDEKEVIERSTPSSLLISEITNDKHDLRIIVYRPVQNADVLVKIFTSNPEHYKSLRIKVTRETGNPFVIHTTKVDATTLKLSDDNTGVLVHLPSVPLDGKVYSIQIESTLPQYNQEEATIQYFTSNTSFQFAELSFVVKASNIEDQIKQTSLWTLFFIFGMLIGVYNIEIVTSTLKNKLSNVNFDFTQFKTKQSHNDSNDNTDIDQIVQSINATKRKPKPRKI